MQRSPTPESVETRLQRRERQHAMVAELGLLALRTEDLDILFEASVQHVAAGFGVELAAIFEAQPFTQQLRLRAGVGWKPELVGSATVAADPDYQIGHTLLTGEPSVIEDVREEQRYRTRAWIHDHHVASGVCVVIRREDLAYGVLAAYDKRPRAFTPDDVNFLQSIANVLAAALGRLASEEALRESEARFRTLADSAPVMIWVAAADKQRTFFSRQWLEFRGRGLAAELGAGWTEGVHPQDVHTCLHLAAAAFDRREPYSLEYRLRRADGEYRWILDRGAPRFSPDGAFAGYVGSCVDITDRQQNLSALRESEARFAGIIASAMDAIITIDDTQTIVLFNQAAELMFRCPAGEALGRGLERFIPQRFRDVHRRHVRAFGESGVTTRRMGRLDPLSGVRSDGEEFPIEAAISQAEIGGKRVYTAIVRDISERKRLEAQLLHSQKIESVGRLAGGIAHDFNNVLTGIFGVLDIAEQEEDLTERMRAHLEMIQKAGERAAELTGQLLTFARKRVIEPRIVDLNELVRGTLAMLTRTVGEDVEIVFHGKTTRPLVRVDPGQFEQVLVNLAVNARDAMPGGGKFVLETSSVALDEEYARLRPGMSPGDYIMLAISDTGAGMDPVTLEHCFEPFYTTKPIGKGTGLGLSSCHGIIKQVGGHIWVYSERGHGTTFRIYLPASREPVEAPAPAAAPPATRGAETLLLVEDDDLVRGVALQALRARGYHVIEAAHATDALTRSSECPDVIHLLISDVVMPDLSGRELSLRLREQRPGLRVLYTSGYTDDVIVHHGVLDPGVWFLPKPYSPSLLCKKVREVLESPLEATRKTKSAK